MERQHVLWAIVVMLAITWGLRALPFLAAQWLQRHPVVGSVRSVSPAVGTGIDRDLRGGSTG